MDLQDPRNDDVNIFFVWGWGHIGKNSVWKMSPKMGDFVFFIFQKVTSYLIDSYFIFGSKKRFWLIAFLTNLWYISMVSHDGDMTVENFFMSTSDNRIFLWNLSFRVYLHVYQKCFRKSSTFTEKFSLRDQRKMWYGKTRVRSCELRVTSYELKT